MRKFRKFIITISVSGFILCFPAIGFSQPGPCDDPGTPPGCCDPDGNYDPSLPTCPIDGGVVALLAAGVGYGLKRARDAKKAKSLSQE